ncbi:hypothetical protein ScPMuIL_009186 [Solemya velum]
MTILPKKKPSKDKNDPETSDHSHGHSHHQPSEGRHEKASRSRNSPTRWLPTTQRDDKLANHDPGGTSDKCNSSHNKRRHRSSPHRNSRKYRGHVSATHSSHSATATSKDFEENEYNSGDEYNPPSHDVDELERWFEATLKEKKNLTIKKMEEDGACLFRSVADQVYGDQEMHGVVRKHCIDYMAKNADYFTQYVTEDFTLYLRRKSLDNCHGNHVEIQAICEIYSRPIEVYQYSIDPINIFHGAYKTDNEPIRISYHQNVHYNSIVNPHKATIGVGLGLPGFQPGLADKNIMGEAVKQSEEVHIEQAMLEDKLKETDWEVTQETIEEQVARESYLQWLRDNEKRAQRQGPVRSATCSATCSSVSDYSLLPESTCSSESRNIRSPRNRSATNSAQNSPQRIEMLDPTSPSSPKAQEIEHSQGGASGGSSPKGAVGGFEMQETNSLMNQLPVSMFGLSEWDEDDILAQVIAQSQQEYLNSLKNSAVSSMEQECSLNKMSNPGDS